MRPRAITALLLALTALVAAGCGSDNKPKGAPIPASASQELANRLREAQNRFTFGDGACSQIQSDTRPAVNGIIDSLPSNVDRDVRDALRSGFDHLFQLTAEQCDSAKGQSTETNPTTTPTETAPTETAPTDTTPTNTTPSDTTPVPTTPDQGGPPGQDGGNGNGKGKDKGNGSDNGNGGGVGPGQGQ